MTEQRSTSGSGLTDTLTQTLATLTRYSITLPFYPLRLLPESLRDGASQPITSLLEMTTILPPASTSSSRRTSPYASPRNGTSATW